MAISFPLPVEWFEQLCISELSFGVREQVIADMTGAGDWITDEVAPPVWQGEISLGEMDEEERGHAEVMFDLLRRPGATFMFYDKRRAYPKADPTGAILGSAQPAVAALSGDRFSLSISGLPAGYTLTRGDLLVVKYSGRRSMHRVMTDHTAAGAVATVDVNPALPSATAIGDAILLKKPAIPCRVVPKSIRDPRSRSGSSTGASLQFGQTREVIE